jgi:CRISPR-associated protein Csx3
MVNLLPAVVIGGPPHAGKSVLFYQLTYALRERGIRHHAIRACPDGEGNWSQESDRETVSRIRVKGDWSDIFVKRICLDLEHRRLPFLVDMGGRPQAAQMDIFNQCTHSVLLLRTDKDDYTQLWQGLIAENGLLLLAEIYSQLEGESTITSETPVLKGILTGLKRHSKISSGGQLFDTLVDRIATLFNSYSPLELETVFFEQAPTECVLNLYQSLHAINPVATDWELAMLEPFLASLPERTPLSVYGAGPNWLYAALAIHAHPQDFYLFDPRLPIGWIQPLALYLGSARFPELDVALRQYQDMTLLAVKIVPKHLDYFQSDSLPFPPVNAHTGLVIDGALPNWLLTALVRLYKESGVAWIAPYYVRAKKAVVVYTRVETYRLGDTIQLPEL